MDKYKLILFILLLSTFIVANINYVSVYDIESQYSLIWLWSSKSIANHYQFYCISFLLNVIVCSLSISLLLLSETMVKIILKYFTVLILSIFILDVLSLGGFFVFKSDFYFFNGSVYKEETSRVYCTYLNIGRDNYLDNNLCGRDN